jgi:hypothetical protein|tara:strand:- start:292 stop:519 length:228 start_codon:yes stop_codon:yes gene_type:complete
MSEKNLYANEDPMWQIHMRTLTQRKRNLQIAQIIDDTILEYYSKKNLPVPDWKTKKDPQWWINYLKQLGLDSRNP